MPVSIALNCPMFRVLLDMKTKNPYRRYFPAWHELASMALDISMHPDNLTAEAFPTLNVYPWYAHNGKRFRTYRPGEYAAFVVPLTEDAIEVITEDEFEAETAAMVFAQKRRLRRELRVSTTHPPQAWMHVERVYEDDPWSVNPPGNLDVSWIDAITVRRLVETYAPLNAVVTIHGRRHGAAWTRLGFVPHVLYNDRCMYVLGDRLPPIEGACREHQSTIPKLRSRTKPS